MIQKLAMEVKGSVWPVALSQPVCLTPFVVTMSPSPKQ